MSNRTARLLGVILTLASLGAVAVVVPAMARRVGAHRQRVDADRWAVQRVGLEKFEYFGAVKGSVTREGDSLRLSWGADSVTLPMAGQATPGLPGLLQYQDWFAILAMAAAKGDVAELERGLDDGSIRPRLVAVARLPAPERDPETWGQANTNDWLYRFWELTPDGAIDRFDEPHAYTWYGKEVVETDFRSYKALKRMPSSAWEFVAAMEVTPGLHTPAARNSSPISYPNYAGVRDDLDAMGWTWPASGAAFLGLMVGVITLAASFVRRDARAPGAREVG